MKWAAVVMPRVKGETYQVVDVYCDKVASGTLHLAKPEILDLERLLLKGKAKYFGKD